MTIFVDKVMREVVVSPSGDMPVGWQIPPLDVSVDEPGEIPPPGVVIACCSDQSLKEHVKRKLMYSQEEKR